MAQVFITRSRLKGIAQKISYLPCNTSDLCEIYEHRLLDFFSIPERKTLEVIKLILESIGNEELSINIIKLCNDAEARLEKYCTNKESRWIYFGSKPAYHHDQDCPSLKLDYENYEIPVEIPKEEIQNYRTFFLENFDLFLERRDVFFRRAGEKFNVIIHNVKEVHEKNSGNQSLTILTEDRDQLLNKIFNLTEEMHQYKNQSEIIKRIVSNAGFNTKKALRQPCYYSNKESLGIIKLWHNYKEQLKDLIIQDLISIKNPDYKFDHKFLEEIGFKKCSKCQIPTIENFIFNEKCNMKLGDFSVQIQGGKERVTGYVEMAHNTKYMITLSNDGKLDCDASVEIDGKEVGTWRVYAGKNIRIERPAHDTGQFTFYKLGSSEAGKIGLARNDKLGLISVLFKPEKHYEYCIGTRGFEDFDDDIPYSAGGTGLSGKSEQKFINVQPLDYDEAAFVHIHLRLVCHDDEPRPLTPLSTSIPPSLC